MGGGFVDSDGFWKPTKEGLGMSVVIDYLEKKYGASMRQKLCQKKESAEGLQTAYNTPMAGGVPPQICEAQTSP